MRVELTPQQIVGWPEQPSQTREAVRIEVPLVGPDERQYRVILLDAEDTFDVIIHNPDGYRECLWSLVKDGPEAGKVEYLPADESDDDDPALD